MSNAIEINDSSFEQEVLNSEKPVVVDFWAPWCGPCRKQLPIVEELSNDIGDKARVAKLNIEENQGVALAYQVVSIPTLMIFKNGEVVEKMSGLHSKSQLEAAIKRNL